MSKSESIQHLHLKKLAMDWSLDQGFEIAVDEVRIPQSGYRADVMAYRRWTRELDALDLAGDGLGLQKKAIDSFESEKSMTDEGKGPGFTAILECKQSRSDFLRDMGEWHELQMRLETLQKRKIVIERLIRTHHMEWTQRECLFPEMDPIDLDRAIHPTYLKVLKQISVLTKRKRKESKFDCLTRYDSANLLYLVVEPGLVKNHEAPAGWGVLERRGNDQLELRLRPRWRTVPGKIRIQTLENISRKLYRSHRER